MLKKIRFSLSLLDRRSRILVKSFTLIRILIVGLDTLGVILIGLLIAKTASEIDNESNSNSNSFFDFVKFFDTFSLVQITLFALFLFTLKSAFSVLFTKMMADVLAKAESKVADSTFTKLLNTRHQDLSEFSKQDLIFALTSSASFAITEMLATFVTLLSEAALLIAMAILFAFVDLPVALGIIIYFGLVGISIQRVIGPKMQKAGTLYADSSIKSQAAINDAMLAFREMLTLRKQIEFSNKFKKSRIGISKPVAAVTFYSGLPRYIVETALMFGAVLLALYLFTTKDPSTAAGILGIFLTGSVRIMASMLPLQNSLSNMRRLQSSAEPFYRVLSKVIDQQGQIQISTDNTSDPVGIFFENVSYKYPNSDSEAIKNVTFKINPGDYVALIGPSGSGKSTIADLMIGLIEPTLGTIKFENLDGSAGQIGYVPQSPGIVTGSILENITLNVDSGAFDKKKIEDALTGAHLSKFIDSLENGINSSLGANADALSGGQMQRIGLARALYSQPGLLVLDEATSALDPETESAFAETLNNLRGKCSIVVIAHRLSTVKNADCVYVVNEGQIVASGKFNDLAKSNELVAKYVELSQLNVD